MAQATLAKHIEAVQVCTAYLAAYMSLAELGHVWNDPQHETKSFKDESWYKSPIGFGSKASVVMAALKQHDTAGSGFIACRDVISALQACHFGMYWYDNAMTYAVFSSLDTANLQVSRSIKSGR